MKIGAVVFLGNPGKEYEKTRHNAGWMVADGWPDPLAWQEKFKGRWTSVLGVGGKVPFLKPLTFMNLSGESVRALVDFFKIDPEALLVVHDELELPFGEVRFQKGGGLGGHNGLRSLKQHLGTQDFHRLRIGIGRPPRGDVSSFVLSRFSADEEAVLPRTLDQAVAILRQQLQI